MKQNQKDIPTKATLFFISVAIRMLWALGLTSVFVVPLFGLESSFQRWSVVTSLILLAIWLFFFLLALLCYMPSMKRVMSNNSTVASNAYHQEWNILKDLGVYLFWSAITIVVSLYPSIRMILVNRIGYSSGFQTLDGVMIAVAEDIFVFLSLIYPIMMVFLFGLLFGINCIRFGKKDIHRRRFFGILSGSAVALVVIFCFTLFPFLLEHMQESAEWAAVTMFLALYPFSIVLIYVFGPFSMAVKEQKE